VKVGLKMNRVDWGCGGWTENKGGLTKVEDCLLCDEDGLGCVVFTDSQSGVSHVQHLCVVYFVYSFLQPIATVYSFYYACTGIYSLQLFTNDAM